MQQSFTFYLTLLVIRLKGLKRKFRADPVNIDELREDDVLRPKGRFFRQHITRIFDIAQSKVTEIVGNTKSDTLVLFFHGGAFISGPGKHHWDTVKAICKETGYTIWMCNYPKAPEHKITEVSSNIDAIYAKALEQCNSNDLVLIGDSAGGTLITALVQRLISEQERLPHKIILVSPVMDASMSNVAIDRIDRTDPMLSKPGVLSAKKMSVGSLHLKDAMISPLYGNFEQFPETVLFLAENDITYPDQKLAVEKLGKAQVNIKVVEGENMPHIWPFLPIMSEAKIALNHLIGILKGAAN